MEKLKAIGDFSILGISPDDTKTTSEQSQNGDESDSNSDSDLDSHLHLDYDDASDTSNTSDNVKFNSFFLSKTDQQAYNEAPFGANSMITGDNILHWLPFGVICS